ncbi:MAG TPA: hypothetical protein PKN61_14715 [Acidobacteriota bacterium]|nr:hypothetical protein [Acidobacteriota bacterium]HNU00294.1 hypothetical protein [Acidobacteriota bacterium]
MSATGSPGPSPTPETGIGGEFVLPPEDRTLGAICYPNVFPILVPLVVLLTQPPEKRALRFHALQGLVLHGIFLVVWMVLLVLLIVIGVITLGCGVFIGLPVMLLLLFAYLGVTIYWSLRVYQDGDIRLAAVTDFVLKHKDRYI